MKHLNKNHKGFSLVELLIAIAILGVVALPLLQVFTLSAKLTGKARTSGEATAAAQSVLEVIEAEGVERFREVDAAGKMLHEDIVKNLCDCDRDASNKIINPSDTDENGNLIIRNVTVGSNKFDAKIHFDRDGEDGLISEINDKPVAKYSEMSGFVYSQPYETLKNPDKIAKTVLGEIKSRTVEINAYTKAPGTDPEYTGTKYRLFVDVIYDYTSKSSKHYWVIHENVVNGKELESKDDSVTFFLMYYPLYLGSTNEVFDIRINNSHKHNATTLSSLSDVDKAKLTSHQTQICPDSHLKFKAFLVKQIPVIRTEDDYMPADKLSSVSEDNPDYGYYTTYLASDSTYAIRVREYHEFGYSDRLDDDTSYHVFSNVADTTYRVYQNAGTPPNYSNVSVSFMLGGNTAENDSILAALKSGNLVNLEKQDRYFRVTISIYESGKIDDADSAPLYSLNVNKLK